MHLSPAEYVIHVFGGVRATARALGKYPSTISKWQNYKDKEGQIGQIPTSAQKLILEKARELGLQISADELIYGKSMRKQEIIHEAK